jgi:hypothetical protein
VGIGFAGWVRTRPGFEEALAGGGSDGNFTSQFTATPRRHGRSGRRRPRRHERLRVQASIERGAAGAAVAGAAADPRRREEQPNDDRHYFHSSVTRCSLQVEPFDTGILDRADWATGTSCRPRGRRAQPRARLRDQVRPHGENWYAATADRGAGAARATLEGVGDWRAVTDDLRLEALTSAGSLGRATSTSPMLDLMELDYSVT